MSNAPWQKQLQELGPLAPLCLELTAALRRLAEGDTPLLFGKRVTDPLTAVESFYHQAAREGFDRAAVATVLDNFNAAAKAELRRTRQMHDTASTPPDIDPATLNWQPVTCLPQLAVMIDGMLASALETQQLLTSARTRPHVLDDATIRRMREVYGTQQSDLWLYRTQLTRWQAHPLKTKQGAEIARLSNQLDRLDTVLGELLSLTDDLRHGTIDRILEMDDAQLGLEFLLGKRRP